MQHTQRLFSPHWGRIVLVIRPSRPAAARGPFLPFTGRLVRGSKTERENALSGEVASGDIEDWTGDEQRHVFARLLGLFHAGGRASWRHVFNACDPECLSDLNLRLKVWEAGR